MRVPSGDQDAISADVSMLVTRLVWPVFMSRTQMSSSWPPRSLDHASFDPSGDHAGSASRKRSFVRFIGLPPIGITHRSPSAVKATSFPSGDNFGLSMPTTRLGARDVKSRLRRVYSGFVTRSVAENGIVSDVVAPSVRLRILPSAT